MHNRLNAIREFENNHLPEADKPDLPHFHLTGGIGWINDPNGFSVYKGEYHLFFQYYPYKTNWGLMHWGHARSKDLIRWERLPAALAPDREYDKDGCFSGSAIELESGKHLLMYTGVCNKPDADGRVTGFQTQCIAIGDGMNYEKYEGNPVIDETLLPENADPENFRDPCIWKDEEGYHVVIGNKKMDDSETFVLLYDSDDALHWTYRGILAASSGSQYGKMWECPNYFHLSGKDILLVSLQGIGKTDAGFHPNDEAACTDSHLENAAVCAGFHPGNESACLMGSYDPYKHCFVRESISPIDHGTDFYAPQTLQALDGRRIMIAWMQNWETTLFIPEGLKFFGQMTLPRELTICEGRLMQQPVRELDSYRDCRIQYQNVVITSETILPGIAGRCLDITLQIRPVNDADLYKSFWIKLASSEQYFTSIRYNPGNRTLCVDRTHSKAPCEAANIRAFPVKNQDGILDLRIIMDRYSLEIFVNDGEQAASFVIYTPEDASSISFGCEGSLLLDVDKYDLIIP